MMMKLKLLLVLLFCSSLVESDQIVYDPNLTTLPAKFQLRAYPAKVSDGGSVEVFFDGVENPSEFDYITVACGDDVQNAEDYFDSATVKKKQSSLRFHKLYMRRCNYIFTYYQQNPDDHNTFIALGRISVPMKESFNAPKQGHLALTEIDHQMVVMFTSGSAKQSPTVRYGLSPQKMTHLAYGNSSTYKASDMCNRPATITSQRWFRDPGFLHKVILSNLKLGTRYHYMFGNEVDGWSDVYSFVSRPPSYEKEAKFIAYADMGVDDSPAASSTAVRVLKEVQSGYDSFLLHFGDISYAKGQGLIWDMFFSMIESYAARTPYMVGIGNHEYDHIAGGKKDPSKAPGNGFRPKWGNYGYDSHGECGVPMFHRFHAPKTGNAIFWYSFNYGGIHVIQISTEHDFTRGSLQFRWLENDLKSVNRSSTPWVILTAHRMMYTTQLKEEADLKVSEHFKQEVEDLLYKYQVNLMMTGHQHSYERSCPVYKKKCIKNGKGTTHIVVGSAGASLETSGFSKKIGNWSVAHVNDFGFLRISSTAEKMTIQFLLNRNGEVFDEVTLKPWLN